MRRLSRLSLSAMKPKSGGYEIRVEGKRCRDLAALHHEKADVIDETNLAFFRRRQLTNT